MEAKKIKTTVVRALGKQESKIPSPASSDEHSIKESQESNLLNASIKIKKKLKLLPQWRPSSVSAQNLSDFFDQLNTLLSSGISLLQALEFARSAVKNSLLNEALVEIIEKIRSGAQLSEALGAHPKVFDHVVLGMIKAAEASGKLDSISLELSRSFAARAEMRSRILQALSYPFLVASVGVITVFVLLVFVVPKLTAIFDMWDTPLPLVTRMLLSTANFMSHGGFLIPIAAVFLIVTLMKTMSEEKRKLILYTLVARVPFFDEFFFLTDFVRLTRTWGMLLRSGVPLIEAIHSSKDVLANPTFLKEMDDLKERTIRGSSLDEGIRQIKWFPQLAQNFLAVGEETGTLDEAFEKISNFYERELDRKVKVMGTFLEPILILTIGLVVGFLVISLLLPIFEMSLVVK